MAIYAGISLVTTVMTFTLGLLVYFADTNSKTNKAFLVYSVFASFLAFSEFMLRQSESIARAEFWSGMLGYVPLVTVLALHFLLYYTEKYNALKNKAVIFILYGPVIAYIPYKILTNCFDARLELLYWGYARTELLNPSVTVPVLIWMTLVSLTTVVISFDYFRHADHRWKKRQSFLVFFAFLVPIFIGMGMSMIIRMKDIHMPGVTAEASLLTSMILSFVIVRYKLFRISLESASNEIIKLMQGYIILADYNRKVLFVNPAFCEAVKLKEEEIKGSDVSGFFSKNNIFMNNQVMENLFKKNHIKNLSASIKDVHGDEIDVVLSVSVMRDRKGEEVGFVIVALNIEERIRLEDELRNMIIEQEKVNQLLAENKDELEESNKKLIELDRLKQNFISIVSHELRTPLTAIKGFLKLIMSGVAGKVNDKQHEFIEVIWNNSERLLSLINELLDFSKIESGTFSVDKRPSNVVTVIQNSIKELKSISDSKDINIVLDSEENIMTMNIDEYRIGQVVTNLVNNSLKFSSGNSNINISISRRVKTEMDFPEYIDSGIIECERCVYLKIKDQGIGMEPENAEKIFERFYQVEDANNRSHEGVGLGLNITKNIVQAHGGVIWATSEGKGKGSEFHIFIPE